MSNPSVSHLLLINGLYAIKHRKISTFIILVSVALITRGSVGSTLELEGRMAQLYTIANAATIALFWHLALGTTVVRNHPKAVGAIFLLTIVDGVIFAILGDITPVAGYFGIPVPQPLFKID